MAIECDEGYHLTANACVPNEKNCEIENGTGVATWNETTKSWNECTVLSCNPGYTTDKSETNETWKQCGRCNNMYADNGELAVSGYVDGCEIASCMHQGQKYILENNECYLICSEQSDETGSRRWNGDQCVHTCNAGYTQW